MRRQYYIACILVLLLKAGLAVAEDTSDKYAAEMVSLINEARKNPIETASGFGMDVESILQKSTDLEHAFYNGVVSLESDERLEAAARIHVEDMFETGYYAHVSPDGKSYSDRISDEGYVFVSAGESMGMLRFSNFIKPKRAVEIVFENMFREQLEQPETVAGTILNPEFRDVGIAVGAGSMNLDGNLTNVYIITCVFATGLNDIELNLFQLVNQARHAPLDMAVSFGYDREELLWRFPDFRDLMINGLPPLTFNLQLNHIASKYATEMIDNGYPYFSNDERTMEERFRDGGYDSKICRESTGLIDFNGDMTPETEPLLATGLFAKIFAKEFESDAKVFENILNPDLKHVGISVLTADNPNIFYDNATLAVLDFAFPIEPEGNGGEDQNTEPEQFGVAGTVYGDLNGDGLYTAGEGIPGAVLFVTGDEIEKKISTNNAGGFTVFLAPGEYTLTMEGEAGQAAEFVLGDANMAVYFAVECPGETLE